MQISFFELENWEKEIFQKALPKHKLLFDPKPLTARNALKHKDSEVLAIFVFSKITKQVLDKFSKLKYIATMSTGFDHIDLEEAKKRGIKVSNVPFYGQNTVAEHAFALLQALNRHIVEAVWRTRNQKFDYKGLMGSDLAGKTIGILGTGNIGQHMIRYANAFNMNVIAYDKFKSLALEKKLNFKYVSLKKLCTTADFISLHLPLVEGTCHIIGEKEFDVMKKSAMIINTGRGPLIDTKALIDALNKNKIGGAALDVLELEDDLRKEAKMASSSFVNPNRLHGLVKNHALLHKPNVIVTPHLAFYTREAVTRIMDTSAQNIKGYINKKYKNLVKM
ncbi:hydroxyacid dehydrogenase [Candidatus Woesearchaeota archaeon]|nr:hydroxyacid dehydrogenase [Candidatus Woesearchaeota archaeon]